MVSEELKVLAEETTPEYQHLGKWVAQISGLPQARCYGSSLAEAVGNLMLTFGKEHGIILNPPDKKVYVRGK